MFLKTKYSFTDLRKIYMFMSSLLKITSPKSQPLEAQKYICTSRSYKRVSFFCLISIYKFQTVTLCKYILCYVQYLQFKILQLKNQHYACKHEKVSNLRSSFQKCHKLFYLEYFITNSTAVPSPKYYCSVAYFYLHNSGYPRTE